jgi:predicted small lipoprotein YifL
MKKITMLAALVAFLAVVGCGGTTPTSSPATKAAPATGKTEEKKPEEKKPEEKKTETPAPEKK